MNKFEHDAIVTEWTSFHMEQHSEVILELMTGCWHCCDVILILFYPQYTSYIFYLNDYMLLVLTSLRTNLFDAVLHPWVCLFMAFNYSKYAFKI